MCNVLKKERKDYRENTAAKEIRGCTKRKQPPVTSRLHHTAHAQLTIFREKICHPNSARQPVKPAARVHRKSSVEGREGGDVVAKESGRRDGGRERKAREALLGVIVVYRFSKSYYPVLLPPPFVSLPSIRDFFLPSSPSSSPSISSAAFLSPSARRTSYMPRSGYKISRVYAGRIRLAWP